MRLSNTETVEILGYTFAPGKGATIADGLIGAVRQQAEALGYALTTHEATLLDMMPEYAVEYSPTAGHDDITMVTVNHKTPDLIRQAVESFRAAYPDVPMIVVDNGSHDESTEYIRSFMLGPLMSVVLHGRNLGHGGALHPAMIMAQTRFVFTMDSDVIVHRAGFLERMKTRLIEAGLYAIGPVWWRDWSLGLYYCGPTAGLYDMDIYKTLPPFRHAPDVATENMVYAKQRGLKVEDFPIFDYLTHIERGTTRLFFRDGLYRWDPGDEEPKGIGQKGDGP